MMTHEEYKEMIKKAASQFKTGKPIFGKDGAFRQIALRQEKRQPRHKVLRKDGKGEDGVSFGVPYMGSKKLNR